jgi:hypothetical protein
MHGTHNVKHI